MPDTSAPLIDYTKRDFTTADADILSFVQATRPADFTDFTQTNLGITLIDLVAFMTDLLSYGQDITAQEVFLATARRYESALRFARSVGAPVTSATAAVVVVQSDTLPANVVAFGAIIKAGQFVSGTNGLHYEVTSDQTITPGNSTVSVQLSEGQTLTETFSVTKQPSQQFQTSQGVVQQSSWKVYVGDATNPANLWTEVSNVSFETSATKTYETFFDGLGRLSVLFGDGVAGKIPDNTVTIIYRTTDGAAGNTGINTVRGAVQANVIGTATTVSITLQNTQGAATGGADRESVEQLRQTVPAFIRTLDKVITINDYQDAVASIAGIGLVFADVPIAGFNGNVVRVHIWDLQNATFVSTSPNQGTTSAVIYSQYVTSPTNRIYTVQQYLRPRTIATVHNVVIEPSIALVDLDLGQVRFDARNALKDVHLGIVTAIVDLFESSSGFLIRISDIYSAVLKVPGVLGFTISQVIFQHIDFNNPNNGNITEIYRTDQDPGGLVGGPFAKLQDIQIPGATQKAYYDDAFLYNNEILFNSEIDSVAIQAINLRSLVFTLIAG